MNPAVHPVHKAGDAQGHPVHSEFHRGQLPPLSEAQLERDGPEFGGGQLLGHIVHHRLDRPEQAAEQVPEPLGLVLQPPQLLLDVPLHRRLCQLPQPPAVLRSPDGVVPAREDGLLKHLVLEHVLQHVVDEGSVLRCCKASRLAGFCLQAVAHEVGEVAGFILIHPGGRHGHPLAIETVHRRGGQVPSLPAARPVQPLHRRGVLWQLGQGVVGRPAPPRLLQSGQRGRQAEGPLEVLLPLNPQIGEQQLEPLRQKTGAALLPRGALAGPADDEPLCGPGTGEVDRGHLPVQQLLPALVQLQAVGGQQGAVVVGQQARGLGHHGDGLVVRPQEKEHLHRMTRLAGGLPRRHPVQGDGDGPHIILGQHQPEQSGKLVQLHGGILQLGGALLQAAAQDGPQLPVLLRQGGLVPAAQLLHPLLQALGQADLLQKTVKGNGLSPSGVVGVFPQKLQRLGHLAAGPVQPLHQCLVLLRPVRPVASGVHSPVLLLGPAAPPQVPLDHIVLQQVLVLLAQVGEAGL